MNDEVKARTKKSMQITDDQPVSWGTVKGTILNYIRSNVSKEMPIAAKILSKIEGKYSLSGHDQSDVFRYKNSVSGIINKITGKSQDWPSSSIFSFRNGNDVLLITLAGIIEYDVNNIKEAPDGSVYVTPSKVHLFNGNEMELTMCSAVKDDKQLLNSKELEGRNFTCDDIRFFPAIPTNANIDSINDIKENTTYEIVNKNINGGNKCYLSINSDEGVSLSRLEDDNVIHGSLSYTKNSRSDDKNLEVCDGGFVNFMPYGKVRVGYQEIDGSKSSKLFEADGCGGWNNDNLSSVNTNYMVNNFIEKMLVNDALNEDGVSEISEFFRRLLSVFYKTAYEDQYDNETGSRSVVINTISAKKNYYHVQNLFNGKYIDQIITFDENGNYLIANKNLKRNASDNIYEVQLGNGNLFIGKLKFNDANGEVCFMDGKFFNRDGKVIDNKKQITLKEASSLIFTAGRDIEEDDLREFALSDRFIVEKGENGYDFTIIGASFENTIKNNKVFKDFSPSMEYINRQFSDVTEFICGEMRALNNQPNHTYDRFLEQIKTGDISTSLINEIRQATKDIYTKTKNNTYVLNNGEKITKERLSAFYSQLSQWQYLYNIKRQKEELEEKNNAVDDNKEAREEHEGLQDKQSETGLNSTFNKEIEEKENNINEKNDEPEIKELKEDDNKNNYKQENDDRTNDVGEYEKKNILAPLASENTLKQWHGNNNIYNERYPKILNSYDLEAIFTSPEAERVLKKSTEKQAVFLNIMKNVVDTEDRKIDLFLKTCRLLHESRGNVCEDGAKILMLSQEEYESFMKLNHRLATTIIDSMYPDLYNQLLSYRIAITDEYNGIKDDFSQAMQFAISGEEQLNMALHTKNCQLFDALDKDGEIRRCCNDVLYKRDLMGWNLSNRYSGYYNEYKDKNSLNTNSNLSINSFSGEEMNSSII